MERNEEIVKCPDCNGTITINDHCSNCPTRQCNHSMLGHDPDTLRRDWEHDLYRSEDERWKA